MLKKLFIIVIAIVLMGMFRSEIKRAGIIVVNAGALVYDLTGKAYHSVTKKPVVKKLAAQA